MCMTPFPERPSSLPPSLPLLPEPIAYQITTYHISSTTPPRGIINIINNIINQYHSGVTNTPSHPYYPSPDSRIDHTNRNGSVISLFSIAIAPPPSQLYTLHCTCLCVCNLLSCTSITPATSNYRTVCMYGRPHFVSSIGYLVHTAPRR